LGIPKSPPKCRYRATSLLWEEKSPRHNQHFYLMRNIVWYIRNAGPVARRGTLLCTFSSITQVSAVQIEHARARWKVLSTGNVLSFERMVILHLSLLLNLAQSDRDKVVLWGANLFFILTFILQKKNPHVSRICFITFVITLIINSAMT
jgi:hypothetical protein